MAEVLYRKYRSQTFDELIGQAHITDILKNAIRSGMISHAYLLVGSRGTGKTSTARILAKALNCTNIGKDGNPCNECDACKAVTSGTFMDLIEIDAASNRGIDQIRELKERIEYSPSEGKYKVYIIDEVHMLTTEAFNALLKTLEEPPPHVVFILATTDVHKLPATILSRCQRYDFHLGNEAEIEAVVRKAAENEGVKLSDSAIEIVVQNANGSYRDALSLLDVVVSGQVESKKPKEVSEAEVRRILGIPDSTMVYYLLEKLSFNETADCLSLINELDSKGVNLQQFVKYVLLTLREILISKLSGTHTQEYSFSDSLETREILQLINLFIDADRKLRTAPLPALILEMIVAEVSIVRGGTKASPQVSNRSNEPKPKSGSSSKQAVKNSKVENSDAQEQITENRQKSRSKGTEMKSTAEGSGVDLENSDQELQKDTDVNMDLDHELIEKKWGEITRNVQRFNGHLYAFLKAAKVAGSEAGYLLLEVPFEFHKERIEAPRSREALNEVFREIVGSAVAVRCKVNESIQRKKASSAEVVLKNIQRTADQTSTSSATSSTAPVVGSVNTSAKSEAPARKRRISKKVEAIFADL